jgi:hypothetical protein
LIMSLLLFAAYFFEDEYDENGIVCQDAGG